MDASQTLIVLACVFVWLVLMSIFVFSNHSSLISICAIRTVPCDVTRGLAIVTFPISVAIFTVSISTISPLSREIVLSSEILALAAAHLCSSAFLPVSFPFYFFFSDETLSMMQTFSLHRFSARLKASHSTALCMASFRLTGLACLILRRTSGSNNPSRNCYVASTSFSSHDAVG